MRYNSKKTKSRYSAMKDLNCISINILAYLHSRSLHLSFTMSHVELIDYHSMTDEDGRDVGQDWKRVYNKYWSR